MGSALSSVLCQKPATAFLEGSTNIVIILQTGV